MLVSDKFKVMHVATIATDNMQVYSIKYLESEASGLDRPLHLMRKLIDYIATSITQRI